MRSPLPVCAVWPIIWTGAPVVIVVCGPVVVAWCYPNWHVVERLGDAEAVSLDCVV